MLQTTIHAPNVGREELQQSVFRCQIVLKTCTVLTKNTISNHKTFSFEDVEILTVNQTFTANYTRVMINKKQIHNSEINTT